MTTDEAKGLFALMGWQWQPTPLSLGNNKRGRLPQPWQGKYEVYVNEIMVEKSRGNTDERHTEYELYDVDRCLTRYAELYTDYIANKKD